MKKSFTLIEILIVVIIMGILATISTKILIKVYQNYNYSKEINRLTNQTDMILNIIASKLQSRVPNTLIGVECNVSNGGCINGNIQGFNALSDIPYNQLSKYKALEWLGKDIYSKRGIWNDSKKEVTPGYSGFVDLKKTYEYGNDEYNITTPDSNFTYVREIDGNWTADYGITGNIFSNKHEVLIFSGPDNRGDITDINHSYGYYEQTYPNNKAQMVFQIKTDSDFSKNILHIKAIDISNQTSVYEKYFLINSAYAIVPSFNPQSGDFNLTLFYNYYPWNGQEYKDGNKSLLASNVTQFKFRDENGVVRVLICIDSPKIKTSSGPLTVCKEKVIF